MLTPKAAADGGIRGSKQPPQFVTAANLAPKGARANCCITADARAPPGSTALRWCSMDMSLHGELRNTFCHSKQLRWWHLSDQAATRIRQGQPGTKRRPSELLHISRRHGRYRTQMVLDRHATAWGPEPNILTPKSAVDGGVRASKKP